MRIGPETGHSASRIPGLPPTWEVAKTMPAARFPGLLDWLGPARIPPSDATSEVKHGETAEKMLQKHHLTKIRTNPGTYISPSYI